MLLRTFAVFLLFGSLAACSTESTTSSTDSEDPTSNQAAGPFIQAANEIEAGRYLIKVAGCNDCHTAGFLEQGMAIPEEDWLTGLPIGFRGPWGTTYPKNLRLSVQQMDEDAWVQLLHTRTALPPMPWPSVNSFSEQDARAAYKYIRSLGPAGEPAPVVVPPDQEPSTPYFDFVPQHMERLAAPAAADSTGV